MEPIAAQPVKITPQLCIHITLCGYITLTPTHKNGPDHTLTLNSRVVLVQIRQKHWRKDFLRSMTQQPGNSIPNEVSWHFV
jgi:hypothetical protein